MTAGERLVQLSGLAGVSAAQHLIPLAGGSTSGARLKARSSLSSGTAWAHLFDAGVVGAASDWLLRARRRARR